MIYEVEFADGTTARVDATNGYMAQRLAAAKFRDKLIVAIREAGLIGLMARSRPEPARKA